MRHRARRNQRVSRCNHRVPVHSVRVTTPAAALRKLPNSTWAELRTAHASGIGLRELARNMNIPAGTVLARAKREGWTRQIQSAKSIARQSSPAAVAVVDAVAVTMQQRGQRHLQRMAGVVERTLPHVETMEPGEVLDRVEDIDRLDKVARRTYGLDANEGAGVVGLNILSAINITFAERDGDE